LTADGHNEKMPNAAISRHRLEAMSYGRASSSSPISGAAGASDARPSARSMEEVALSLQPDGSLIQLDPASWFVCFVPPIDKQFWHWFVYARHAHVFALRPEPEGGWTLFEPWWTRLLVAKITTLQAAKFLRWGSKGDVLLVRETVPGSSSQLRGMMTCAALAAHMLGRRYFVLTPHQLYRRMIREPNVCKVDVSVLLTLDLDKLAEENSRLVAACESCAPGHHRAWPGAAKPFCAECGRDL
jgi:hypothetical protein